MVDRSCTRRRRDVKLWFLIGKNIVLIVLDRVYLVLIIPTGRMWCGRRTTFDGGKSLKVKKDIVLEGNLNKVAYFWLCTVNLIIRTNSLGTLKGKGA